MATDIRKPGDLLVDRHLKDADEATREAAREHWKGLARVVLRIATRLATEAEAQGEDSRNPDGRRRIRNLP
jgi:hypothetical protein